MAEGLTPDEVMLISIIQQVCSTLSLLGCLFIIGTFRFCKAFHKPINRLVFYASFGNIMASICFIMAGSFIDSPDGAGCQMQAFLLHTFVGADALWTLAMAINVYLTFYHRFDGHRLRRMELPYLILCYGIPFAPAFAFIFIRNGAAGRVYGSAILWCWITPKWDILRIATFYGPIWVIIAITLAIYIRSGGTIYRKRQQLRKVQGSSSGAMSSTHQVTVNNMKTTEVTIKSEDVGEPDTLQLQSMGHQASVQAVNNDTRLPIQGTRATQITAYTSSSTPRPSVPCPSRRANHDINRAAWQYTKCALLFFAVILITWIPSSANRVYSHIHPKEVNVALQFMSATVLPLQGFWNAVIYAVMSWAACKSLLKEKTIVGKRSRRHERIGDVARQSPSAEETNSRRQSKLWTILNTKTVDSESMMELANNRTGSDDGRSVSQA